MTPLPSDSLNYKNNPAEITQDNLNKLENHINKLKITLNNSRWDYRLCIILQWCMHCQLLYLATCRSLRPIVCFIFGWRFAGVLIGSTIFTGIIFVLTFSWIAGLCGFIFGAVLFLCLMFVPQDARIFSKYQELEVQKAKKIDECNQFRESLFIKISELTEAQKRHSELSELLRKKQIQASKEYRRQQLLKRDWKSLRSVPFENYLEEVFKELGYSVETTKITGDQGADLIVSNCGHKIAIQIKGYFSSVSNGAVQEAFTSKGYYSCEACAVITNSHFTASAKDLANRIGCVLIDEDMLPALVLGNYDLWQQHLLVMSQPKIKLTD